MCSASGTPGHCATAEKTQRTEAESEHQEPGRDHTNGSSVLPSQRTGQTETAHSAATTSTQQRSSARKPQKQREHRARSATDEARRNKFDTVLMPSGKTCGCGSHSTSPPVSHELWSLKYHLGKKCGTSVQVQAPSQPSTRLHGPYGGGHSKRQLSARSAEAARDQTPQTATNGKEKDSALQESNLQPKRANIAHHESNWMYW